MIYTNNGEYKPSIFFTSDTHFSQKRTLELSKRPFKSVEEMDQTIIDNWNSVVKPNDTVYHLGDFGNANIRKKLNGHIRLITGNYEFNDGIYVIEYGESGSELHKNTYKLEDEPGFEEYVDDMYLKFGFESVYNVSVDNPFKASYSEYIDELNFDDIKLGLSHLPSEIERAVNDPNNPINFGLFGHIHKLQMVRRYGLNVGIDCNNYFPMSLDDVKFYINGIKNHYDSEVFGD